MAKSKWIYYTEVKYLLYIPFFYVDRCMECGSKQYRWYKRYITIQENRTQKKRDELSLTLELMSKLYKKTIVGNLSNNSILLEKITKKMNNRSIII